METIIQRHVTLIVLCTPFIQQPTELETKEKADYIQTWLKNNNVRLTKCVHGTSPTLVTLARLVADAIPQPTVLSHITVTGTECVLTLKLPAFLKENISDPSWDDFRDVLMKYWCTPLRTELRTYLHTKCTDGDVVLVVSDGSTALVAIDEHPDVGKFVPLLGIGMLYHITIVDSDYLRIDSKTPIAG